MTAYFLRIPSNKMGQTIHKGVRAAVVHAPNAAIAQRMAAAEFGMSKALWLAGTATAIGAASGWAGWGAYLELRKPDGTVLEAVTVDPSPITYSVSSITAGTNKGAGYVAADTFSVTGAAGDTPATGTVSTVAVAKATSVSKTTAGTYASDPAGSNVAVTGGAGTGLQLVVTSNHPGSYNVNTVAIASGHAGVGYLANDVVSIPGTGGDVAATVTITAVDGLTGAVLTFALASHGLYASDPTASNKATTSSGAGTGLQITVATVQGGASGDVDELGIALQDALNATASIAGAAFNESTNVLTVAGTGDGLGDHQLTLKLRPAGCEGYITSPVGSVVDGGSSGSAVTVALPADNYSIPGVFGAVRTAG